MAGTLANPVLLDPFQAITEVGWRKGRVLYIAVSTRLNHVVTAHDPVFWADECTLATSETISEAELDDIIVGPGTSSASIGFHSSVTSPDRVLTRYAWFDPEDGVTPPGWIEFDSDQAPVTGIPAVSESDVYEEWSYAGVQGGDTGWQLTPASGEWNGLFPHASEPDSPAAFDAELAPQYIIRAAPYTEEPKCYRTPLSSGPRRYGAPMGGLETLLTATMDVSGVSVTHEARTFTATGTALISGDEDAVDLHSGQDSILWVLCAPTA